MAICSSSLRLSYLANSLNDIDSMKQCNGNSIVTMKALGSLTSSNGEFRSILRAASLTLSSRCASSMHLSGKGKKWFEVRCMSQPQAKPEFSDPPVVTVLQEGADATSAKDSEVFQSSFTSDSDNAGGDGYPLSSTDGNGNFPSGGGGGGGGGGDGDYEENDNEEEFGPVMKFEEVLKEAEARGAKLPSDMLEAAKTVGIRKVLLLRYLDLQGSVWPLGFAIRSCSLLRDRMLADPAFLFKIGTEVC
uniref:Uncharacterized protein n=1 Tax=Nelumbo nucifera TaxID=4432 RepID=A0A822ZAQ2_NELNU|nr:TPA_asm: hypothetical protein HUJ06_001584 [Nelumbo nucifera]